MATLLLYGIPKDMSFVGFYLSLQLFSGLSYSDDRAHSGAGAGARGPAVQGLKAPDAGAEIKMLQ